MSSKIQYIKEHYTNFNALSFAKYMKEETITWFRNELDTALSALACLNIRKNNSIKEAISWARSKRKDQDEVNVIVML